MPGVTNSKSENVPNSTNASANVNNAGQNNEIQNQEQPQNVQNNGRVEPVDEQYEPPLNVRELTQTDRINRQLLKSFLEHITSENIQINGDDIDINPEEDNNAEWQ